MCDHEKFMRRAIELARATSLEEKAGGPFGCVIVKDGKIVGEGANRVLAEHDPTCHAEMNAIRNACKKLGTHDLTGCTVYSTGEPCPMCYGACWWARVDHIFYASTVHDALVHGSFDDSSIYEALCTPLDERNLRGTELLREEMIELWGEFRLLQDQIKY
ncbi:nucleoside deaminase [bacterium]|nr:nucleoside deaminase [bacterium]